MTAVTEKQSSRYLFLVGKIRALEKKLFDSSRFSRLTENKDTKSFLNDLSDSAYHDFIVKENFERGLKKYIHSRYDYFRKNMQDSAVLDIFMIRNDILNYINYHKGLRGDEFYESGVFDSRWWKTNKLPGFFVKVEGRLKKVLGTKGINEAEERLIEKVCMDEVCDRYIKYIPSRMVLEYWRFMLDIKNLLRNVNNPQERYYFSGGNIKESFWKEVKVSEDIPPKLEVQSYMKRILEERNRIKWEPVLKRWMGYLIKEMRKITFGPEPVVSYFLSIIEEAVNLTLIYTGINLELSDSEIKEKLNLAYV